MLAHDLSYLLNVLHLADGETEETLDEQLQSEAEQLGVDVADESRLPPPKAFCSDYARRSGSTDSRASQSTGLLSNYSDFCRDHAQHRVSNSSDFCRDHAQHDGQRRPSRASLSFRDYDAFLARGISNGRHSMSFSPLATPSTTSTFSLPLSRPPSPDLSAKKHCRRIRALNMLKLHSWTGAEASPDQGCLHCPPDSFSQRLAVHKLPCGHFLCTQALRVTINLATDSQTGAIPSCCGCPLPGSLVELVMTQEEQDALLDKLSQWDEAISIAPSADSSRRDSITSFGVHRPEALTRTVSEDSRIRSLPPRQRIQADRMMQRGDYKLLRARQTDQRNRFLRWVEEQRVQLLEKHEELKEAISLRHETAAESLAELHASALSEAEDKQVQAESDLRITQVQEKRDNATALKHMEAYCAGKYGSGDAHDRPVTEKDRFELDKTRRTRDQMDSRHESQINVLRGEQCRRMRLRSQRQDREMQDLKRQQRQQELEMERLCTSETHLLLGESVEGKQRRMCWRWELQMAMYTKMIETETGSPLLNFRLPTAEWSTRDGDLPLVAARAMSVGVGDFDAAKPGISHGFAVRGVSRSA